MFGTGKSPSMIEPGSMNEAIFQARTARLKLSSASSFRPSMSKATPRSVMAPGRSGL